MLPSSQPSDDEIKRSLAFVNELNLKMRRVVDDFAAGMLNRTQFHMLYDRYQSQLNRIMQLGNDPTATQELINAPRGEETILIKRRLTARAIGLSVYSNRSGLPLETMGEFSVDPALLVPMLSSYRAATREIFKAGMRSTTMENGQWLWFVPGHYTTLIALFSDELSRLQVNTLERMHRDFETANRAALEQDTVDASALAFPFLTFVQRAHQEQHSAAKDMASKR
ncbi:MAG TPA: hypothetical protein VMT34_13300 [Aggregatilineales bacterium]|nr:hypothetical protein [Aggregatilineales bacterium]